MRLLAVGVDRGADEVGKGPDPKDAEEEEDAEAGGEEGPAVAVAGEHAGDVEDGEEGCQGDEDVDRLFHESCGEVGGVRPGCKGCEDEEADRRRRCTAWPRRAGFYGAPLPFSWRGRSSRASCSRLTVKRAIRIGKGRKKRAKLPTKSRVASRRDSGP